MRKDIFNEIYKHLNNFSYNYVMLLNTNLAYSQSACRLKSCNIEC